MQTSLPGAGLSCDGLKRIAWVWYWNRSNLGPICLLCVCSGFCDHITSVAHLHQLSATLGSPMLQSDVPNWMPEPVLVSLVHKLVSLGTAVRRLGTQWSDGQASYRGSRVPGPATSHTRILQCNAILIQQTKAQFFLLFLATHCTTGDHLKWNLSPLE